MLEVCCERSLLYQMFVVIEVCCDRGLFYILEVCYDVIKVTVKEICCSRVCRVRNLL
jgi:hypothetical protein